MSCHKAKYFCFTVCGNGIVESGEACDGGPGCGLQCRCLSGWSPTVPRSTGCTFRPTCGNGFLDPGEQCDSNTPGCFQCRCLAPLFVPTFPFISLRCRFVGALQGLSFFAPNATIIAREALPGLPEGPVDTTIVAGLNVTTLVSSTGVVESAPTGAPDLNSTLLEALALRQNESVAAFLIALPTLAEINNTFSETGNASDPVPDLDIETPQIPGASETDIGNQPPAGVEPGTNNTVDTPLTPGDAQLSPDQAPPPATIIAPDQPLQPVELPPEGQNLSTPTGAPVANITTPTQEPTSAPLPPEELPPGTIPIAPPVENVTVPVAPPTNVTAPTAAPTAPPTAAPTGNVTEPTAAPTVAPSTAPETANIMEPSTEPPSATEPVTEPVTDPTEAPGSSVLRNTPKVSWNTFLLKTSLDFYGLAGVANVV
jgi:hypothetical protein